ncbi:MAG: hypothetical protein K1X35_09420 [Caulobacteraceae bacterium]|nr:hypothetical protein [Caulobacteraceae bacterium]
MMASRSSTSLLLVFGGVSLAAVAVGVWVCAANGVPTGSWARNLAAWGVGAAAAVGVSAAYRREMPLLFLGLAPLALGAAFLFPDQQGVHRWLDLGPVRANAAMLALPAAVVGLSVLGRNRRWPWGVALATQALAVAQPDASQATALGCAILTGLLVVRDRRIRIAAMAAALALIGAAWMRQDPLQPVPEVEGAVGLAFQLSPVAGLAALLLPVAAAFVSARAGGSTQPEARRAGLMLGVLLLLWAVAPRWGAFPVPLVGVGMSPILGAWLGMGLLAGVVGSPGLPAPFGRPQS